MSKKAPEAQAPEAQVQVEVASAPTIRQKMIELENLVGHVMQMTRKYPGQLVALQRELQFTRANDHPLLDWEDPKAEGEPEEESE